MSLPIQLSPADRALQAASNGNLRELRDILGECTARSLQEIALSTETAIRNRDLDRGVWYPKDYILALGDQNPTRFEYLKEGEYFVHGWAPKKYFKQIVDQYGGVKGKRSWAFIAKNDVLPADALKAVKVGLSMLDCGVACQIARYNSLLDVLGEAKFNRLFSVDRVNIDYSVDDSAQPMRHFVKFTPDANALRAGELGRRKVLVGQVVSFDGVPGYSQKHPQGMGANYNVVCLKSTPERQLYVGHGLPSKGSSEVEIASLMVEEYNEDPDHFTRTPTKNIKIIDMYIKENGWDKLAKRKVRADKPLNSVKGFGLGSQQDFCVELIRDLVRLPLEQISMDYVRAHPSSNQSFYLTEEQMLRGSHKANTNNRASLLKGALERKK